MNEKLADGLVFAGRLAFIALLAVINNAISDGDYGNDTGSNYGSSSSPRDHANKNAKFYRPTGRSRGYGRRSY